MAISAIPLYMGKIRDVTKMHSQPKSGTVRHSQAQSGTVRHSQAQSGTVKHSQAQSRHIQAQLSILWHF